MKKLTLFLSLALLSLSAAATTINDVINEFKDEPNAQHMVLPEAMLNMAKCSMPCKGDIKSLEMLSLENCDNKAKKRFNKAVAKVDFDEYEELVTKNEGNNSTKILVKTEDTSITEMLIVVSSDDNCSIVRLIGNISAEDINNMEEDLGL